MYMNKHFYGRSAWVFSLFAFFAVHCFAQSKILTLKDAIKLAETNYPLAKAKASYTKAAGYEVESSRRTYIPALKLHEQLDYATTNALQGTYLTMGLVPSVSAPLLPQNSSNPIYGSI